MLRWKLRERVLLKEGDERVVSVLLWYPRLIDREWRWLGHAKVLQRCIFDYDVDLKAEVLGWRSVAWAD